MTHGITHERPPEPIVEVTLPRAEADALAQTIALMQAGDLPMSHALFGREYGALAALLRAGQRLPEVRLALTFNLLSVAFGCAMSALLCPDDPIFAGLSRPARGALNLAVVALWAGAERFASAPRLN